MKQVSAAQMIRQDLKKAFPNTKFSVKQNKSYNINIEWNNSICVEEVDKIVTKYKWGNFDGTIDCTIFTDRNDSIPQVKFIHLERKITEDIYESYFNKHIKMMKGFDIIKSLDEDNKEFLEKFNAWNARGFIYKKLYEVNL